tara:strand:+ start:2234 stop:3709 length:1476 start_codon:yes stop_codon:yes gene_type:complete
MNKKIIFIGGGLREHIIICLLPIIHGMCVQKNIEQIIFERELGPRVKSNFYYKKLSKNFKIFYLKNMIEEKKSLFNYFLKIILFIFIFLFSFFLKKEQLLNKKINWILKQFFHAFWDTGIVNNNSSLENIEFKSRVSTCKQITNKFFEFLFLKKFNIRSAIIGHSVYSERVIFALLRKNQIETFLFQKGVLTKQIKNKDRGFKYLDTDILKKGYRLVSKKKINNYWKNALRGKVNYLEAKIASKIKKKDKRNLKNINVVMLHIFKDSAFEDIDENRLFPNYFTWIVETLKIIKDSKEIWILRNHPSANKWGEDQKKIIKKIFKKVFDEKIPKNIYYEENVRSNIDQYKISKRIVTFSGNSHLEAACFGIKPIVISDTTLSNLRKSAVFKPFNLKQYKKILLNGSKRKFELSERDKDFSKRIIYFMHNVINLTHLFGKIHLWRSDPKYMQKIVLKNAEKGIKKNSKFLFDLGTKSGKVFNQSISKNYFYKFL